MTQSAREKVRLAWEEDDPFWPRPLIAALEERGQRLALQWAIQATRQLLPVLRPAGADQLLHDLERLDDPLYAHNVGASGLLQESSDIWCRPGRDYMQTAVSRLFAAAAGLERRERKGYLAEVEAAVAVLARDPRCSKELLGTILDVYEELMEVPA